MPAWLLDPTISAIITIVSLVIGVISAIITVIFFFKSRVVAVPKYIIENNKLINLETGGFPEDISMSYKDMQISRLNKTTLHFSNAGRKQSINLIYAQTIWNSSLMKMRTQSFILYV